MSNKIELVYENGFYNILMNGKSINVDKDIDEAIGKFKQVIRDNVVSKSNSWESIEEALKEIEDSRLEINSEYKTLSFGNMKYFYTTGKIFYLKSGQMVPLVGGFTTFNSILSMYLDNEIENYEEVLDFCKEILDNKGTYRFTEGSIIVSSAAFNYGSAEYIFGSGKINKGASITKGSFNYFKAYVFDILKA